MEFVGGEEAACVLGPHRLDLDIEHSLWVAVLGAEVDFAETVSEASGKNMGCWQGSWALHVNFTA